MMWRLLILKGFRCNEPKHCVLDPDYGNSIKTTANWHTRGPCVDVSGQHPLPRTHQFYSLLVTGSTSIANIGQSRCFIQEPINGEMRTNWLQGSLTQSRELMKKVQCVKTGTCEWRLMTEGVSSCVWWTQCSNESALCTVPTHYSCLGRNSVNPCKALSTCQTTWCCQLFVCSFGRRRSWVSTDQRERENWENVCVVLCAHKCVCMTI